MTEHPNSIELWMVNEDLSAYPRIAPPRGYTIRRWTPSDVDVWIRIWAHADHSDRFTPALFHDQFGADPRVLVQRMLFLCDSAGSPVGTAAAWFIDLPGQESWGRVHWIAIDPSHQRKGLARPLLSACCRRMHELGHPHTQLSTDSFRLPAINLYLNCGFLPDIRTAEQKRVWRNILQELPAHAGAACRYDRYQQSPVE